LQNEFKYVGSELDLFSAVHNWKSYWSSQLQPFLHGDVLEVGAGLGANTPYLNRRGMRSWTCLEPDPLLTKQLTDNLRNGNAGGECEVVCGTLQDMQARRFDTILYIDVLEHIEHDRQEMEDAARLLRPGGRVIVLAPAHQWLFTPFDAAIGHYRRYDRAMLRSISPPSLHLEKIWYLDSAGLLLSGANRLFLRQSMPTKAQLHVWDSCVIPVSRVLDFCLLGSVGKSIIAIWRRVNA
jgi:SAM-dependent methyltransferase